MYREGKRKDTGDRKKREIFWTDGRGRCRGQEGGRETREKRERYE